MLTKDSFFCQEKKKNVEALVEVKGGNCNPMTCTEMLSCAATTFCRFVNPLTTRNPLKPMSAAPAAKTPALA